MDEGKVTCDICGKLCYERSLIHVKNHFICLACEQNYDDEEIEDFFED